MYRREETVGYGGANSGKGHAAGRTREVQWDRENSGTEKAGGSKTGREATKAGSGIGLDITTSVSRYPNKYHNYK